MANSIGPTNKQNTQELADLNDEYRKKRREVIDKNESSLQALKNEYSERKKNEQQSGEAAVSHIRKEMKQAINSTRDNANQAVELENNATEKQVANSRLKSEMTKEQLKAQRDNQDAYYNDLISRARSEKSKSLSQEYRQTKEVQEKESHRRSEIQKNVNQELDAVKNEASLERVQAQAKNRDALHDLNLKYSEESKKIQTQHDQSLKKQKDITYDSLKKQLNSQQATEENEQKKHTERILNLKHKVGETYAKERSDGDLKLNSLKKHYDESTQGEVHRGTQQMELVRGTYDKEIKELHQKGEKEVDFQNKFYKSQLQKQDEDFQTQVDEKTKFQNSEIKKGEIMYKSQLEKRDKEYKKSLISQNDNFQKTFLSNEKRNRETMTSQNDRLVDAMVKQKHKLLDRFSKYDKVNGDPFYKMKDFESRLVDNPNYYLLRTKVPAHEIKNVDVIVKDDHVVVTGQRNFSEKIKKGERYISTTSNQSFREVIPLKHPAVPKGVQKSYEDNTLVVMIPKISLK
ncbi:MAG: hypothetical protein ABL927_08680 [Bdellovibrionales bacterium]